MPITFNSLAYRSFGGEATAPRQRSKDDQRSRHSEFAQVGSHYRLQPRALSRMAQIGREEVENRLAEV